MSSHHRHYHWPSKQSRHTWREGWGWGCRRWEKEPPEYHHYLWHHQWECLQMRTKAKFQCPHTLFQCSETPGAVSQTSPWYPSKQKFKRLKKIYIYIKFSFSQFPCIKGWGVQTLEPWWLWPCTVPDSMSRESIRRNFPRESFFDLRPWSWVSSGLFTTSEDIFYDLKRALIGPEVMQKVKKVQRPV